MTYGHGHGHFARDCSLASTAIPEAALTPKQKTQMMLARANAKFRAEQAARLRPMTEQEREAFEVHWQQRTERALRAKEAQKAKKRTIRARSDNPAPAVTGAWAKAMSLQAAMDTRLTMGARVALQVIRALTARAKRVSRSGLAVALGVHPRTAQRYLSELRERGYIRTRLIANKIGWFVAQVIEITEKVLPKHHRPRIAATLADGLARCLSTLGNGGNWGETALSLSNSEYQTRHKDNGGFGLTVSQFARQVSS